jgi:hypothetical protein
MLLNNLKGIIVSPEEASLPSQLRNYLENLNLNPRRDKDDHKLVEDATASTRC